MKQAPNLFTIATKELSQDAFITWLFQWSNPACAELNEDLHKCGLGLLQLMFWQSVQFTRDEILQVEAGRQWDNVDVWVEVFLKDGRKLLVIVEDKIFASEHSNQLERYRQQGIDYCRKEGFILTCIYLKIGSEPLANLQNIREKGFAIVTRQDIIQCLEPFKEIGNDIVNDFIEHLNRLELAHHSYLSLLPKDWKGLAWVGFYQLIESRLSIIKWHWVNNPSGGFWNLCMTWKQWQDIPVYLQIEETRVCYKIALGEDETGLDNSQTDVNRIQDYVYDSLMTFAGKKDYTPVRRPGMFVHRGSYRTLAVIDPEQWLGNVNELLQPEKVIQNLEVILHFYHDFINYMSDISYETAGIQVTYIVES